MSAPPLSHLVFLLATWLGPEFMTALYILLFSVLAIWPLWVIYVAVMRLQMVRDTVGLTLGQKILGYPALAVGLLLDGIVNVIVGSILLLEPPWEWTLSARLWRLSNDETETWRRRCALWIRKELLDSIDPRGYHKG